MKYFCLLLSCCVLSGAVPEETVSAADSATVASAKSAAPPNAAIIYWQSFAAMPTLDAEQRKKFEAASKLSTSPLDDELQPIVARFGIALGELRRAGKVPHCDWQLDYAAGPGLLLPHLQKARQLSRAALLRARLRFAAGDTDEAIADVLAAIKLARDCGSSPLLICLLVDATIERSAITVLAANLPRLKPEQLGRLTESLKQLPQSASLAEGLRMESQSFGNWMGRLIEAEAAKINDPKAGAAVLVAVNRRLGLSDDPDPTDAEAQRRRTMIQALTVADVRGLQKQLLADYEEMAKIATLDYADQPGRWTKFEAELSESRKLSNPKDLQRLFSVVLLPSIGKIHERAEQLRVFRILLQLGVQAQHRPDAVQTVLAKTNVKQTKTETGFELRYAYPASDKTEVLHIGPTASKTR